MTTWEESPLSEVIMLDESLESIGVTIPESPLSELIIT